MITVVCPGCGHEQAVLALPSTGWCSCGADYKVDIDAGTITWTFDPDHPSPQPFTVVVKRLDAAAQ